jgi:1-aminocyclopropane-1-carboxylate deaminase/D-cysteine desulfhydrase-like pyridoxal-dependent ACC family enzyme
LTDALEGPRILINRDDLTGLAFGGNKTRYLEFTLAEAIAQKADAVVLSAVVHSNHCRQCAAAAAKLGLKAVLVLRENPSPMGFRDPPTGNYLLDQLFGAEVRFADASTVRDVIQEEMDRLKRAGHRPFTGLSAVRSRVAYIQCVLELDRQSRSQGVSLTHVYIGSGSNSLAGLVAGFSLLERPVQFVGIPQGKLSDPRGAADRIVALAREAADMVGLNCSPDPGAIEVADAYSGPGFGVLDDATLDAVQLVARSEGVILDPTYTGKGFAGLIDHVRKGRLGSQDTVAFVHTGGTPLTFVYGEALLRSVSG